MLHIISPLEISSIFTELQLPFMSRPITSGPASGKIEYMVTIHDDPWYNKILNPKYDPELIGSMEYITYQQYINDKIQDMPGSSNFILEDLNEEVRLSDFISGKWQPR